MAAATVATGTLVRNQAGIKRQVLARLTAPANGDTWVTGLSGIDGVQITMVAAAAADQASVTSISGGTITFTVAGTARDLFVTVIGI